MKKHLIFIFGIILITILLIAGVYVLVHFKLIIGIPLIVMLGFIYAFSIIKLDNFSQKLEKEEFDDSYKNIELINDAKISYGMNFYGKVCYSNNIQQAFEDGANWQKELLLKNAIDCSVDWYDGPLLNYTQEQQDYILIDKLNAKYGDKIKIIILKNEEL